MVKNDSLLNRSRVRDLALALSRTQRGGKFTRVEVGREVIPGYNEIMAQGYRRGPAGDH